jgi:hypothetical protein
VSRERRVMVYSIGRGPVEGPRPPSEVSKGESEAKGNSTGGVCGKGPMKLVVGGFAGSADPEQVFYYLRAHCAA